MTESNISITEPKRFRLPQIVVVNAFGILIGLPCGVAFGIGAVALVEGIFSGSLLLSLVGLAALALFAGMLFLTPTMWGNPYVRHLIRKAGHSASDQTSMFLVQLALHPRLHVGVRGWLEDADDIGLLTVSADGLTFTGDHVSLHLTRESIATPRVQNVGWRGYWFCGRRIELTITSLDTYDGIEFIERNALTALGCVRNTNRIVDAIKKFTQQGAPTKPSTATE